MAFRSVGINLPRLYLEDISDLTDDLEALRIAGPDFVEVGPHHLGVILGGSLGNPRARLTDDAVAVENHHDPRPLDLARH